MATQTAGETGTWRPVLRALAGSSAVVTLGALAPEPVRRRVATAATATAAGVYLNGGLRALEFPFAIAVAALAARGPTSYRALGAAWLLHAGWDVIHHRMGRPLIDMLPSSSLECAVTDTVLAGWLLLNAPGRP